MYNNFFSKFFDFKKNLFGILSLLYISFIFFISIFTYLIAPDSSSNSNNMNVSIHSKEPGFKIDILENHLFFDLVIFSLERFSLLDLIIYYAKTKDKIKYLKNKNHQKHQQICARIVLL